MSKIFKNLKDFKVPATYLQIHYRKGFKVLDKAGEIINNYHIDDNEPFFQFESDGLIIKDPTSSIDVLKITPNNIWAKYYPNEDLHSIYIDYCKQLEYIFQILEINKILRIGWRNHFVHEFKDRSAQIELFKKIITLDFKLFHVASINTKLETGFDFDAILNIQAASKNDTTKTPAILFDIDIFQLKNLSAKKIDGHFKSIWNYLNSNSGFLNIINKINE